MVVALSVFSGIISGPLSQKSPGQGRNAFTCFLNTKFWTIAGTAAVLSLLIYLSQTADAYAEAKVSMQNEAADSFVFGRANQNDIPLALKLSPYTPAPNEYTRFTEMSKDDRRLALGQVAVGLLAQTLEGSGISRAMLAVTDPLRDAAGGKVSCKQRFSMSSYLLKCRIKF